MMAPTIFLALALHSAPCEIDVAELKAAAEGVLQYVEPSDALLYDDLIYRTPAQGLREAADALDRKDAAIARLQRVLRSCDPVEDEGSMFHGDDVHYSSIPGSNEITIECKPPYCTEIYLDGIVRP